MKVTISYIAGLFLSIILIKIHLNGHWDTKTEFIGRRCVRDKREVSVTPI